jgi:RHS repeat-associated protein
VARYNEQTTINSFTYTPDGMGNRTSMTDLAGMHNYTYDNVYQLTQATHPNMPTEQFSYDAVGNRLTTDAEPPILGRSTEYVYDFENRLIEVNYTGMLAQYKYDPFGRRIEKNVNGDITRHLYDGTNIVTEYDGAWNVKAKYVFTLDVDDPLTVTQGADTFYYHKDGLGSVVNLADIYGNVVKSYTYKSFGEVYSEMGSLVQPFTFTGREYDPESGLYYYRARYYDPRAGRFLTKDPIGFAGGDMNLYRYVTNNPINFIDPSGKLAFPYHGYASLYAGLMEGRGWESFRYAWDSMWTDYGTQSNLASDTNIHGTAGYIPGVGYQTPEQGILGALQRVADEKACGRHGSAMHTLQDLETPWHAGWEWRGNNPFTNWDALGHWFLDWVPTPLTLKATYDAYKTSRRYLQQLK